MRTTVEKKDVAANLSQTQNKLTTEEIEERRKRLLSVSVWDDESIKEIEDVRKNFKWKIEKY
ncbi:MAG: hypothetical protein K1X86_13515 [Ignavibacteria bacterium]|nr:hypothetical protein [Ignavibacteria bacterium]